MRHFCCIRLSSGVVNAFVMHFECPALSVLTERMLKSPFQPELILILYLYMLQCCSNRLHSGNALYAAVLQ